MLPLPPIPLQLGWRNRVRLCRDYYVRLDSNDYSVDPTAIGRFVLQIHNFISTLPDPEGWLDRRTNFDLRRNEEPIHLFEIGVDGSGLRQLTAGQWSDLDPAYAPSGDVVFVSERCGASLQCNEYDKDETSCNLYACRPDGSDVRRLSV